VQLPSPSEPLPPPLSSSTPPKEDPVVERPASTDMVLKLRFSDASIEGFLEKILETVGRQQ